MTTAAPADAHILFTVAETTYALRSRDVQHMEMLEQITPVPNAPSWIEGVVFSRGRVVPVLNLRARFGFERAPSDLRTRLLVVQVGERVVGLLADSAREFTTIPPEAIQPPPEAINALSGRYLEGIATLGERLVLVLDLAAVLEAADPGGRAEAGGAGESAG
jgi:purine-binding chemotaxis protein CheW